MRRILIFIGHYLPARRAGGPVRSTASMVESLSEVEFHIFTSDTDFKSREVLDGVQPDRWQGQSGAWALCLDSKLYTGGHFLLSAGSSRAGFTQIETGF